jgi:hypothetical protein
MLPEPGEVSKSKWKCGFNLLMQNRLQTFAFYFTDTGFLIEKQAQLGNEADVRKRYLAIHKELVRATALGLCHRQRPRIHHSSSRESQP